jgi:hypothetical protein
MEKGLRRASAADAMTSMDGGSVRLRGTVKIISRCVELLQYIDHVTPMAMSRSEIEVQSVQ